MKKRDLIIILAAAALALALLLLVRLGVFATSRQPPQGVQDTSGITLTLSPLSEGAGGSRQLYPLQPGMTRYPAQGYLLISVNNRRFQPLPLTDDLKVTIDQENGRQNVAEIRDGVVHMASASCPGQECVHQGEVSLDNRDLRVLYNQVICLPNTVLLEVLSIKEAQTLYGETP